MSTRPAPHRWRVTAQGNITIALVAFVIVSSFVQRINLMVLLAAFLVCPIIIGALVGWRNLVGLHIRRFLPGECHANSDAKIRLEVCNSRRLTPAWGICVDDQVESPDGTARTFTVNYPPLEAQGERCLSYSLSLPRRGRYQLPGVTLRTAFPFGAVEVSRRVGNADELVVFPKLGELTEHWHVAVQTGCSAAARAPDQGADQTDIHSLREFRDGDNLRHVHWRTTARRGELMVKEFDPQTSFDALFVIDPLLPEDWTPESTETFETMISFVATACVSLCRWPGNRLVLAVADAPPRVYEGQTSPRYAAHLLTQLADLQPATGEGGLDALAHSSRPSQGPLIVWILSMRPLSSEQLTRLIPWLGRPSAMNSWRVVNVSRGELDSYFRCDP